jgi:hypothetical protein
VILLDACRDNPFIAKLRSVGTRATQKGGLAKIEDVGANTIVAYAAKAGSVSYETATETTNSRLAGASVSYGKISPARGRAN